MRPLNFLMLEKLTAKTYPWLARTSQLRAARWILHLKLKGAYGHLLALGAFSILSVLLLSPIFGSDYPPGVDTPTFLHLSWVTKLAASGQLADPFQDPYWYGGFSYLVSYPPLGYGLVGVISFVTRIDLVVVYLALMVVAYGGVAASVYWFAGELGLQRWTAVLAGTLTALAYPLLNAVFIWGWFTSVLALPLALASFMLLERSLREDKRGPAVWAGVCMALSILTHHMTGLSIGLGMLGWFIYHAASGLYPRRQVIGYSALFAAVAVLIVSPWGIPFLVHSLDVGFRREVPGLWDPSLANYRSFIVDSSRIGDFIYPSYLGITLLVLATGGTIYALMERRRMAGVAIALLVLTWFSLGADTNPLIRVYPFSGLDVARFHLYMVPLMALMGGAFVERLYFFSKDVGSSIPTRAWYSISAAAIVAILLFPAIDAWKARSLMEPYRVEPQIASAIEWLGQDQAPVDGTAEGIYPVELFHWLAFLIPYEADRQLIDGWHDEGAPNVQQIRELRMMSWTGSVEADRAYQILTDLDARYVLVDRTLDLPGGSTSIFWNELVAHPEMFDKQEQWGDVGIFQVIR